MATQTIVAITQEAAPKSLLDHAPIEALIPMESYAIRVEVILLKDSFQPGKIVLTIDGNNSEGETMRWLGASMTTSLRGGIPLERVLDDLVRECGPGSLSKELMVVRWLRNTFINPGPCSRCGTLTHDYEGEKVCWNCKTMND